MKIETMEVEAKDLRVGDIIMEEMDCKLVTDTGTTWIHGHKTVKTQNVFWTWGGNSTKTAEEIGDKRDNKPFKVIRLRDLVR